MSQKTWYISVVLIIVVGIFLGTTLGQNSTLHSFFTTPETTEQIISEDSPWEKEGKSMFITAKYNSPAGEESHTITLALDAKQRVAAFTMTIDTKNTVSKGYQEKCIEVLNQKIIGKTPSEIAQFDTIAGASLTTRAFVDAIQSI